MTNRETLKQIQKRALYFKRSRITMTGLAERMAEIALLAGYALKRPMRNCDRFDTGDVKADAKCAMEAILNDEVSVTKSIGGIAEYLLSPVEGKEGCDV